MTSKQLVYDTLEFRSPERAPRQMWLLPWAQNNYPQAVRNIQQAFPDDIVGAPVLLKQQLQTKGDIYAEGDYIDEWGCHFTNIHKGVIGEVKEPIIAIEDEEWNTVDKIHVPMELLSFDAQAVNVMCAESNKFITCGACPRPFEQLQFIRGTESLYMDLMDTPPRMLEFMQTMHSFYCELLTKWAKTDVDALTFMDDWGSQQSLLISPELWCKYFKPMYKDYIDIAHSHGKKIFMHSDGNTKDIFPHLVEMGLDAINSQIFCTGLDVVEKWKGQITFWGEIDRRNLLPSGTTHQVRQAVRNVYNTLWENGGCIAQLEFGPGAKPENIFSAFDEWNAISQTTLL